MDKKTEVPAENRVNKGWRLTRLAGDSAALAFGSLRGAPEAHRWAAVSTPAPERIRYYFLISKMKQRPFAWA